MYGFGISLYQTNKITFTEAPVNISDPYIDGEVVSRSTVRCYPGDWNYVTSEFSYQWLLDGNIASGGNEQTYIIDIRDIGKTLSCQVSASNVYGTTRVQTRGILIRR
jgi:hypothetical protein